jgi:hypothetical protein
MLLTGLTLCLLAPGVHAYEIDQDNAVDKAWNAPWDAYDRVIDAYNGPVRDATADAEAQATGASNDAWGQASDAYAGAVGQVYETYDAAWAAFHAAYGDSWATFVSEYAAAGVVADAAANDVDGLTPCGSAYDGVFPNAIDCMDFVLATILG